VRFPWLQVDTDFIDAKAAELGALLGISRREAAGLALDLWRWVLSRSPPDRPPDGILSGSAPVPVLASAVSWQANPEHLLKALVEVGMVEVLPEGLRVRGVSRYAATWEKNRRRTPKPQPERNRTGAGPESMREPERKTQTHTQKEDPSGAGAPDAPATGGQKPLFDAPRPPKPDPEALRGVWNDIAVPLGHQRWEAMSDARKKAARLALEAVPDLGRWAAWLRDQLQRPFNRGENGSGWMADVDWFLRAKTRDLVRDFNPAVAAQSAKTPSGGDRPRLPPRESPPESSTPAAPPRRVVL
jgi:hypothetical protein